MIRRMVPLPSPMIAPAIISVLVRCYRFGVSVVSVMCVGVFGWAQHQVSRCRSREVHTDVADC